MSWRQPVVALLVLATTAGLPGLASAAPRFPVVPGVSVGRVRLGDAPATVRRKMGKPSQKVRRADGLWQDSWLGPEPKAWSSQQQRDFRVIYKNGKAVQIEFNTPDFITTRNISTKSSLRQFRAKHPRPRVRAYTYLDEGGGGHVEYYYDDVRGGLCFQLGTQDYFDARVTPESLRVHRRGVPVIITAGGKPTKASDELRVGAKPPR